MDLDRRRTAGRLGRGADGLRNAALHPAVQGEFEGGGFVESPHAADTLPCVFADA